MDPVTRVVSVSVAADLSSLIPGILPYEGGYQLTGTAEARIRVLTFSVDIAKKVCLSHFP